ncbi:MAG TPA: pyridoxamine 5'-phosphate oxidase [Candidatus Baltobacteraceae bacterium]|nr:pyridoxamine 5'-phosphate oxidase [Candidatus Baltobacteraceae bacterium]
MTDEIDLAHMRGSYQRAELHEERVCTDPIEQVRLWLDDAVHADVPEPNAMCLSTCFDGLPSSRMVLLRRLSSDGFVFFTSYFSRKGREIERNAHAALLFYWPQLERQIRVEGHTQRIAEDESDEYFASRPRGHQLGAWASEQSEPVENRELLEQRMHDYEERFEGEDVPRPHSWGGYVVIPQRVEFWQGRLNRMHDRLEFTRVNAAWSMRRLQP